MRVIFFLLGLIIVLGWLGVELRSRDKALSNVLLTFSGLFAVLLIGAFFGWY